jgi:ribosomal protein L29
MLSKRGFKMKITKARLRQIILEELQSEVASEEGEELEERWMKQGADPRARTQGRTVASKRPPPKEDPPKTKKKKGEKEEEETVEEGSGDRNDPDREEGRGPSRQRPGSAGNPGDLEELKRLIARELKNLL